MEPPILPQETNSINIRISFEGVREASMFMLTLGSKLIILFTSFNRIFLCMVEISKNEINRLRVIISH